MQYQVAHPDRTDALIAVLREITLAYKAEGSREERLALIETLLEKDADQILAQCMAHEAVAGSNHLSSSPVLQWSAEHAFSVPRKHVAGLDDTRLRASRCGRFLDAHKCLHSKWLAASHAPLSEDDRGSLNPLDLSFVADKWWTLVTGNKDRGAVVEHIDRSYFELCVFSNVMLELKSGDLRVPGSDQFSDYRKELVSKDEFERGVALYGEQAGIPVEGPLFIARLREQLEAAAKRANDNFPTNEYLRIEMASRC